MEHWQLLPEWAEQEAIILAWPDQHTDWQPWLPDVEQTYLSLIQSICHNGCGVLLLIRQKKIDDFRTLCSDDSGLNVLLIEADYNDTWVRDYGFLTCQSNQGMHPIEFTFNGWGQKFNAHKDNQTNKTTLATLCKNALNTIDFVAEGGALEIDENGCLLSTELCLSNPKRNGKDGLNKSARVFHKALGSKNTLILKHGHLEGDDTDGHIDTLVRYTPNSGLVIQACHNRTNDSHFQSLNALVEECSQILPKHNIYTLPLPDITNKAGERLPASYANYLINNGQILAPVYGQPEDEMALAVLAQAYPRFKIVPVQSQALVQQFGSIHCISMQVPKGTLKESVINQLHQGVSVYAGE